MNRSLIRGGMLVALCFLASPGTAQERQKQEGASPYLGVIIDTTGKNVAHPGALVDEVSPNSPAEKAGLKAGDIVTKVGSKDVRNADDLANAVRERKVGDKVQFHVVRAGKEETVTVKLTQRPAEFGQFRPEEEFGRPGEEQAPIGRQRRFGQRVGAFLGVQAAELTPELRQEQGLGEQEKGVLITEVVPGSPASACGLRSGDVVTSIDGKPITTPDELRTAIQEKKPGESIKLGTLRRGAQKELTARLEQSPSEFGRFGPPQPEYRAFGFGAEQREIQELKRRVQELEERLDKLEKSKH